MKLTPPTDRLYKFSAIIGLIILFFSIYYPMQKRMELKRSTVELELEAKYLEAELKFSPVRMDQVVYSQEEAFKKLEDVDVLIGDKDINTATSLLDEIDIEIAQIDKTHSENGEKILGTVKTLLEIEAKEELLVFEMKSMLWLMLLCLIGTGGGLWMSLDGFYRRRKIERQELGLDNIRSSKKRKKKSKSK